MKKQVLIIFTGPMELGGVERSLLSLLDSFDYERYDVDLFLYGHHGPLFDQIDKRVNLLPEVKELSYLRESFMSKLLHGCFFSALLRVRDGILSAFREIDNDQTWAEVMRICANKLEKKYDAAISFFRPFDFMTEKVNADTKIGWIHTDYSMAIAPRALLKNDYSKPDKIVAVSNSSKSSFCALFPEFEAKTYVIQNILSPSFIDVQASLINPEPEMPSDGSVRLLSIGRFCTAKNFDNVPVICRLIRNSGLDVKWYLIGYGPDEALIRRKIEEAGMGESVVILGKKENPYPYIKACDLYVQPSRYEGKCVSVLEAQILGKPVVISKYPTASSQLEDGVDGVIVPQDNEGCAAGITKLLQDTPRMEALRHNCLTRDYSNRSEIEKLYALMECT